MTEAWHRRGLIRRYGHVASKVIERIGGDVAVVTRCQQSLANSRYETPFMLPSPDTWQPTVQHTYFVTGQSELKDEVRPSE